MTSCIRHIVSIQILAGFAITATSIHAEGEKKVITMADYGLWRTVSSTALSHDGNWMTFDYRNPEASEDAVDERKLRIRNLTSEKSEAIYASCTSRLFEPLEYSLACVRLIEAT